MFTKFRSTVENAKAVGQTFLSATSESDRNVCPTNFSSLHRSQQSTPFRAFREIFVTFVPRNPLIILTTEK
jgi:hypothetical protein